MSATYLVAKDEMFLMFQTAWDLGSAAIVAPFQIGIPHVYYPGVERPITPPANEYCGFLDLIVVEEKQATLAIDVASLGQKMYNNRGILRFQLICPLKDAENSDRGARLASLVRNAFRGKRSPCGTVFLNSMFTQSIPTEVFSKFIMTTEYNYNDIA